MNTGQEVPRSVWEAEIAAMSLERLMEGGVAAAKPLLEIPHS